MERMAGAGAAYTKDMLEEQDAVLVMFFLLLGKDQEACM